MRVMLCCPLCSAAYYAAFSGACNALDWFVLALWLHMHPYCQSTVQVLSTTPGQQVTASIEYNEADRNIVFRVQGVQVSVRSANSKLQPGKADA